MNRFSIGSRLALFYLGIFLLAEVIFGVSMYVILRQDIFDIADAIIEARTADLQRFLEARQNLSPAQLQAEIAEQYRVDSSQNYLEVANATENFIYRSPFLAEHPLAPVSFEDLDRPVYENRKLGSGRFRFLSRQIEAGRREFLVRVGIPMQAESKTLEDFRVYSFCVSLLLLFCFSAVGHWFTRRVVASSDSSRPQ